jgi:hypothetical protein
MNGELHQGFDPLLTQEYLFSKQFFDSTDLNSQNPSGKKSEGNETEAKSSCIVDAK